MPDNNRFARDLFTPLPSRYDQLAEILSFGQNGQWRRAMVSRISSRRPHRILDVASGTAGVAIALTRSLPEAAVVGVDLTEAMLRQGVSNVRGAQAGDRIRLVAGRAERLPFPDASFDALTFTYLLRYVSDPAATLAELARVVRPGGTMASLEFCVPPKRTWRYAWHAYTRLVLPAAGLATGGPAWGRVGGFLGPNITRHYQRYPVSWTVDAWRQAGFDDVGVRIMSLGGGLVMWGTRAGG